MAKKTTSQPIQAAPEQPLFTPQQQLRLNNLEIALGSDKLRKELKKAYQEANGDWEATSQILAQKKAFEKALPQLAFSQQVAEWTEDNEPLVRAFHVNDKTNSLYDIARNYSRAQLVELLNETAVPREMEAAGNGQSPTELADTIYTKLFHLEPTAMVQRIIASPELTPIADPALRGGVDTFFSNQPAFNIRAASVYEAFKNEKAFENIASGSVEAVKGEVKRLQRAAVLSPVPEAVPVLMKADMASALRVSELPEQQFVQHIARELGPGGENIARQIHANAVNARIRNEQALIAMKELQRGTGVAFIDRSLNAGELIPAAMDAGGEVYRKRVDKDWLKDTLQKNNLSWDLLFGDADICECGECNSVYSAAAYFVDLLQYLRNNNLDKWAEGEIAIKQGPKDISGTPLEKLLNRRPDLGCLELTCQNTNTLLPYIDLVNEVMENYIVYHQPRAFNVEEDQTSGELLAQPYHTEYEAYCILQKAVYPFTLPYHQPIDATRIYLEHLGTSRYELIDTFRSPRKATPAPEASEKDCPPGELPAADEKALDKCHKTYLDRAAAAEYLGLTQEEYVILTKEAFVSKAYWEKQCNKSRTDEEYRQKIGLRPVHEYYGYSNGEAMLGRDENAKMGLTFVKDQFLRRTGVDYKDLVDLLKTQCLNPSLPQGKALDIMDSVRFSYRYLQQLVDQDAKSTKGKYLKLLDFLKVSKAELPKLDALLHPDPCHANGRTADDCVATKDLEQWVYRDFERIGKMIVLEGGAACQCLEGQFFMNYGDGDPTPYIGASFPDGMEMDDNYVFLHNCKVVIRSENRFDAPVIREIGRYQPENGRINLFMPDGSALEEHYYNNLSFRNSDQQWGFVESGYLYRGERRSKKEPLPWLCGLSSIDTCDLDSIRLIHLDGSPITTEEYDRIHRFIRLWRKLGWTIDEVDKAVVGLSKKRAECADELLPETGDCDPGDLFDEIGSHAGKDGKNKQNGQSAQPEINWEITPDLLHQLAAVKKLLDKTGLEVSKLLAFWADISTAGERPLYKRLFLTHNLIRLDQAFKADDNGQFLTQEAKLTEHLPVIMAALNLTAGDIAAIMEQDKLEDKLTLSNLSRLYRYRLLSKVLGLRIPDFLTILPLFGDPFKDADTTLRFLKRWGKMEDAGFDHRQLNYLITGYDDPKKPLAPTQKAVLQLAKALYDGLNAIEENHKGLPVEEELTTEWLRSKAILLFDLPVADKIVQLLEGTAVFATNAPKNLQTAVDKIDGKKDAANAAIPPALASIRRKINYDPAKGRLQAIGILTPAEKAEYLSWEGKKEWVEALERIEKQQGKLFQEVLSAVFIAEKQEAPERKEQIEKAEATIKEGDIYMPFAEISEGEEDPNTAPKKRMAFMEVFLPYLRRQLRRRFILDTLSGLAGLEQPATEVLITEILKSGMPAAPIFGVFESIRAREAPMEGTWSGYLIPSTTANYTFIVKDMELEPNVSIEGELIAFTRQEDPDNEWWSGSLNLQAGKLYRLRLEMELKNLYWKTPTSAVNVIPTAQLLPDFASDQTRSAFIALQKAAILVNGFNLSADELRHFHQHAADFGGLDFNKLSLKHWLRLEAYTRLRDSLPQTGTNLLEFFRWAQQPDDPAGLAPKITGLTLWKEDRVQKLLAAPHFNLDRPEAFRNEKNLLKLQKALKIADKIGMDIGPLFDWSRPTSNFKKCRAIAEGIQKAIRARYRQEDWEQVVKPLSDKLRENQKQALIAYLLQQDDLIRWGVTDADGLFEYFLIDVQMDACMETSRIKQSISSVQLFVQRCFLGLEEEKNNIPPGLLDRGRWDWIQRYRVWEANRKVFLYPENWIESNLRDDKSPFFRELESELLQKDINKQNVTDALKAYLYKVDEVANMEVVGLYIEEEEYDSKQVKKLHVFSRTRNAPYFFYYRYYDLLEGNWYPWEKMQVDIPSYDVEDGGDVDLRGNGCYLTPVVWNGRLLVFFPQFLKKTKPNENNTTKSIRDMAEVSPNNSKPVEYWEIKMAWSEYRNGKWTQKAVSKEVIFDIPTQASTAAAIATLARIANEIAKEAKQIADKMAELAKKVVDKAQVIKEHTEFVARQTKSAAETDFEEGLAAIVTLGYSQLLKLSTEVKAINFNTINTDNLVGQIKSLADDSHTKSLEAAQKAKELQQKLDEVTAAGNTTAPKPIPFIQLYEFVPVVSDDVQLLGIKVFHNGNEKGLFEFNGNAIQPKTKNYSGNNSIDVNRFHYNGNVIRPLQISSGPVPYFQEDTQYLAQYVSSNNSALAFYHSFTKALLGIINLEKLTSLFEYGSRSIGDWDNTFGGYDHDNDELTPNIYHELKRPYSLYNWELFFHTPVLLAEALSKAQQYEEAMKWYHFVFNPIAEGAEDERFWRFLPFRETKAQRILDSIFNRLQPNAHDDAINEWRSHPFQPHLVARSRPVAYMKWVVMKYIDNLIAWGDHLFRQDTIESLNQATQLYVLAGHILGPRPQLVPKRGKILPQTYRSMLDRWDAFSNAMAELEIAAPYSNQIASPNGSINGAVGYPNIFGFASTLYFCIPNNPKLMGYWDTVADRLFKIRHCQNIEGVFRKLALFEPPIDPGLLVKAAAQGLSLSSVLNDLNTPMPNYRFYYLLQKALELCNELKSMGNAMLSAIEKRDNEAIALLRAKHENTMHNLVMEVKEQQREEAEKTLRSLQYNRKSPEYRLTHFQKILGMEASLVAEDVDFKEVIDSNLYPDLAEESGFKLTPSEKLEIDKSNEAQNWQKGIGWVETIASILHAFPNVSTDVKPIGLGVGFTWGPQFLASAAQAVAKGLQITANELTYASTNAGKKTGFLRQLQERVLQANLTGHEIKQIDKQITAQQIRIQIAGLEIANQQKQIDNAREVEEFLRNKYTNEELYTWMRGSLKTLYHQVYSLAYELAKKAEKVFRFERGLSNSNFIQPGYWDAGREGLLAGEQLYVGLKQLEAAYHEQRGYDYEVTKHISLRQINPLAILQLKETGKCEFALPEVLFDMDYPGHYKRRIKSLSVSIPCVAGPYTGLNATLRLLGNKFRHTAIARDQAAYQEENEEHFHSFLIPITAIAASYAQNESGMFELNFKDERYLPFEGAGAVSRWSLELPAFRQFDYETISDVVLHLRYTAGEGGERLKKAAGEAVLDFLKKNEELGQQEGLFAIIDLKHDLPNEWHRAMQGKPGDTERILSIPNVQDFLPYYARMNGKTESAKVKDVILLTPSKLQAGDILAGPKGIEEAFTDGIEIGAAKTFVMRDKDFSAGEWKLVLNNTEEKVEKAVMVLRFVL